MSVQPIKLTFKGASGADLAARLDVPAGSIRAYALFAHCFTCSKDLIGARKISESLTRQGIAVLRFDFTGLGGSGGDFASTNFSTNIEDLFSAIDYLRQHFEAPCILIGHSLGGRAILSIAGDIEEVKAVVTIGSPDSPAHVAHQLGSKLKEVRGNVARQKFCWDNGRLSYVGNSLKISKNTLSKKSSASKSTPCSSSIRRLTIPLGSRTLLRFSPPRGTRKVSSLSTKQIIC